MHAEEIRRPTAVGGQDVDVQGRGIGGDDGARLADFAQLAADLLLQAEILEHRLDHQIAITKVGMGQTALKQSHALGHLVGGHFAPGGAGLVIAPHDAQPAVQRLGADLHQAHGDPGIGEVHGDAAAHGAGADDANLSDMSQNHSSFISKGIQSVFAAGLASACASRSNCGPVAGKSQPK